MVHDDKTNFENKVSNVAVERRISPSFLRGERLRESKATKCVCCVKTNQPGNSIYDPTNDVSNLSKK